jgi:DNA-binding MarR family transcriptional regulator
MVEQKQQQEAGLIRQTSTEPMSLATGNDLELVRNYAQKLADHHAFLILVLYYVAKALYEQWLNLMDAPELPALRKGFLIDRETILRLEEHFKEYLDQLPFWAECATAILSQLTTDKGFPLEQSGGLASGFRDTDFSESFGNKEAEIRDRYALIAAHTLLERFDLLDCSLDDLDRLLGLELINSQVKAARHKLSQVQKQILARLEKEAKGVRYRPVPWKPEKWFGEQTKSERAVFSRALRNLEARELITRRSAQGKSSPERTTAIELTALGYRVAKC